MKEIWKPIPGYLGKYEASNIGRVKSLRKVSGICNIIRKEPTILKPTETDKGYQNIKLCLNGKGKYFPLGRLVLSAFVSICPKSPNVKRYEASHLNGNPRDNRLENLKWETSQENNQRKKQHGTWICGEKFRDAKLSEKKVLKAYQMACNGVRFTEIAKRFGVDRTAISQICYGKTWKHLSLIPFKWGI